MFSCSSTCSSFYNLFFIFFPNQTQQPRTQIHHKNINSTTQELKSRSLEYKSRPLNSSCSSLNYNTINTEFSSKIKPINPDQETNHNKSRSTQSSPDPTTTDQHNQTTTTKLIKNVYLEHELQLKNPQKFQNMPTIATDQSPNQQSTPPISHQTH